MTDPIPATMRAMLLTGHGGVDRLVLATIPTPRPGPGEVLVRIGASAVNNTDINLRLGWYSKAVRAETAAATGDSVTAPDAGWAGDALHFPRIQGADGAGRIVEVGDGVPTSRLHERVLIDPILRHGPTACYFGSDTPGSFADFTVVPSANAVAVRSPLTDTALASFPCSYLAALHMVRRAAVTHGQRVVITGASGGVGAACVQWCQLLGAEVIAVAARDKHPALHVLGAHQTLERTERLTAALGSDSVDAVLDVVGGPGFTDRLQALRPHGQYATAGAIGGPIVELDLRTLYLKDLTLHGCTIPPLPLFRELVEAIESGALRPLVASTRPLEELALAQTEFEKKLHIGKITLTH